jgi:hypothetical protein
MKSAVIIILIAVIIGLVFMLIQQSRPPVLYGNKYVNRWPATWNFDWRGGGGYDRSRIMYKRGPYHQSHGAPHSTPGYDGRPRR